MRTSKWLLATYAAIIFFGILLALPNVLPQQAIDALPDWLPKHGVTLGLDLRGGSHLVLEVDSRALVSERLSTVADDARSALRDANVPFTLQRAPDAVTITLRDPAQQPQAEKAIAGFGTQLAANGRANNELTVTSPVAGTLRVTLNEQGVRDRANAAIEQSLGIINQRINQIGVSEPTIQRVGSDRILVQLPGLQDPTRIRTMLGSTAKLTFHWLSNAGAGAPGVTVLPGNDGVQRAIEDRVVLSGERLVDARPTMDQRTGQPVVSFRLDTTGARSFGQITTENVGRPFAIVLDGRILSAPVIHEPITGGSGQISGAFTITQANDLAALLRAGSLPAPLTVVEERTVGPDLGSDAIQSGMRTALAGFGLVVAFMMLLYGRWGLVANLALGLNVVLTFAALSIIPGATLTLPGIAGIALGIGLAVDANVLINERIREETRRGLSAFAALDAGFNRAYATIVDSNLTALIATLILFYFGAGAVRGFAVTMGLGIAISMFTAVAVVRAVMTGIVRRLKLKKLDIRPAFRLRLVPEGTAIRFMRARFMGIAVSAVLSLASIALFITPGLNYGVDFRGGIQMEVMTSADLATLRSGLEDLNLGEITLQEFGKQNSVLVRAERQPGGDEANNAAVVQIRSKLTEMDAAARIERSEVVGPKVSGELATAGVVSVILASLGMLIYIWVRFEWPFAVGAIVTLILDVTKTVGFFALTGLDFNLTAIAALLTLIGYSVNDKVVVYDRMRENMRKYRQAPLREIIDRSINETLGRSLYTSVTAFLSLLPMAIWGGSAVSSFAIPMVFGIAVAASSSVFIAAPILLFLGDWRRKRRMSAAAEESATAAVNPA